MNELKNCPNTEYKHGTYHQNLWPGDMQKYD